MAETRVKKGDVVRYVLEESGIPEKKEAVMVGDREHDILGAKENGLDSVGVLFGYGDREELEQDVYKRQLIQRAPLLQMQTTTTSRRTDVYKRQALACGAKLILECEKRGLYPSWDAHNPASAALAQKLGYHMEKEYPAYVVSGSCEKNNGG